MFGKTIKVREGTYLWLIFIRVSTEDINHITDTIDSRSKLKCFLYSCLIICNDEIISCSALALQCTVSNIIDPWHRMDGHLWMDDAWIQSVVSSEWMFPSRGLLSESVPAYFSHPRNIGSGSNCQLKWNSRQLNN